MNIFSINPGFDGAWALAVDDRVDSIGDMPLSGGRPKRCIWAPVLANHMRSFTPDLCVVEAARAMSGRNGAGTFQSGMALGAALAIPGVLGVPVELISQARWELHFKLRGADGEAIRHRALDLCPWLSESLHRKRDNRRAEALLIGLYAAAIWDPVKDDPPEWRARSD